MYVYIYVYTHTRTHTHTHTYTYTHTYAYTYIHITCQGKLLELPAVVERDARCTSAAVSEQQFS